MARILMTGGSSFTGEWIARELATSHEVHCAITLGNISDYSGARKERLERLGAITSVEPNVRHEDTLAEAISRIRPDVVLVHAHPMQGFRDDSYDASGAWSAMTRGLDGQMDASSAVGARWLFSGSMYEPTPTRAAVSPYGVSKRAVWESIRQMGARHGVEVARITVPNPFGPGEEGRLGTYLAGCWGRGDVPEIKTPRYVRDNIPVTELTRHYVDAVHRWSGEPLEPSGYIETNGEFVARVSRELSSRWGKELPFTVTPQAPHPEPLDVANRGPMSEGWSAREQPFWDDYSAYLATIAATA